MATFWLLQFVESIRLRFFQGVTTLKLFDCYNVKRQTSNAKERINRRFSSKNRKYSSLWNTAHKFFNSMACRTVNIFAEESNTSLPWRTAGLSALKSSVCIPVFLIYPCYPPCKYIKESLLHTLISAQAANTAEWSISVAFEWTLAPTVLVRCGPHLQRFNWLASPGRGKGGKPFEAVNF